MKKIVPFNNVLQFNTDVREITAISLEPEIKKYPDMISGVFYISGEYKITDGQLDKEQFNFELPFDIALSNNYDLDSLLVDIDDFRYDLVSDKNLKVNIDLYIDGEIIEEPLPREHNQEELEFDIREESENDISLEEAILDSTVYEEHIIPKEDNVEKQDNQQEYNEEMIEPERIDLLKEMLTVNKEEPMNEDLNIDNDNINTISNDNDNNNIFEPNQEEKYVTYRVYKVLENDTIDTILSKYNITKEILADYNNIENITPGDKLIIPANEK